jgi:hypothetical protein
MASGYDYKVLTASQIKLLDEYTPWAYKVHLSELIDQALEGEVLGIFVSINVALDIVGGRDLWITREGYFGQSLHVGGGYGDTGMSVDQFGNITTDGFIDCSVGGLRNKDESIPNAGTAGVKNEWTYGSPDGGTTWYIYVCVEDDTWRRVELLAW